jgi:hypothetical protein
MANVNKMVVLPENTYATLLNRQKYATGQQTLSHLSNLDENMQQILSDAHIPADQKVGLYNMALKRFMETRSDQAQPQTVRVLGGDIAPSNTQPPTTDQGLGNDPLPIHTLLHQLNNTSQKAGKALLDHLAAHSQDIQWTRDGRLIYDNKIVPDSNITDLLHDVATKGNKQAGPTGWEEFRAMLKATNAPKMAYGNRARFLSSDKSNSPSMETENLRVIKFWFFDHWDVVSMVAEPSWSTQVPIIHWRSFKC